MSWSYVYEKKRKKKNSEDKLHQSNLVRSSVFFFFLVRRRLSSVGRVFSIILSLTLHHYHFGPWVLTLCRHHHAQAHGNCAQSHHHFINVVIAAAVCINYIVFIFISFCRWVCGCDSRLDNFFCWWLVPNYTIYSHLNSNDELCSQMCAQCAHVLNTMIDRNVLEVNRL